MKCKNFTAAGLLSAGLLLLTAAPSAFAVGTVAGTGVDNTATIIYDVGGVTQTAIESSPTGNNVPGAGNGAATNFVVDQNVDLTVTEVNSTYTDVAPGQTQAVLEFQVTNTGNAVQDYLLSAANNALDPFAGTENFDPANIQVFVESGATPGYQPAEDTLTFVDELAPDDGTNTTFATVYVVADTPAGQVDGDIAAVTLTAQSAVGDTALHIGGASGTQGAPITTDDAGIADNTATVQRVLADGAGDTDGARDGTFSDTDAFRVLAASLTLQKTSQVISDPINGTTNPKAIPGAVIEYTITVNNAGGAAPAQNIVVSDSLAAELANGSISLRHRRIRCCARLTAFGERRCLCAAQQRCRCRPG